MFREELQESVEEMMILTIMDHAEEEAELKKLSEGILEVDNALQNLVSQEAWQIFMDREGLEAEYRIKLVKNVLATLGIPLAHLIFQERGQA